MLQDDTSQDDTYFARRYLLDKTILTLQDDTYFTGRYLLYRTILTLQDDTYFTRRYLLYKTILTLQVKEAGGDLGMRLLAKCVSMIGEYTV